MTIEFDAISTSTAFAGGDTAKTASLVLGGGANRIVVAGITIDNAGGFSAVTFNGVAMTLVSGAPISNGTMRSYLYYILEASLPVAGTYNLSVDPVSSSRGGIWCVSLKGVKQQAPEAVGSSSNASSVASFTSNITTLTANAWCIDNLATQNDRTHTADAGQTERVDFKDSTVRSIAGSTKPVAAAGATTLGWTFDSASQYAHLIAAWAEEPTTNALFFF